MLSDALQLVFIELFDGSNVATKMGNESVRSTSSSRHINTVLDSLHLDGSIAFCLVGRGRKWEPYGGEVGAEGRSEEGGPRAPRGDSYRPSVHDADS